MTEGYYTRIGDGSYDATSMAQGAWTAAEQHMGAASGLVVEELARYDATDPTRRIARISLDILGTIHMGRTDVEVRVVRPGRRIELVEAVLSTNGRPSIVARVWRLAVADTTAWAATEDERMPGPDASTPVKLDAWPSGYVDTIELRRPAEARAGSGGMWLRVPVPIVAGEPSTTLAHLLCCADVANGIAPRVDPRSGEVSFPNVDLQLHLYRDPVGEWFGLSTRQQYGPSGTGLTSSVMHDVDGPFGHVEQILMLAPGGHV